MAFSLGQVYFLGDFCKLKKTPSNGNCLGEPVFEVFHSLLFDVIPHPSVSYCRVFTPILYLQPSSSYRVKIKLLNMFRLFKAYGKTIKNTLNKTCTAYNRFDETAYQSYFEEAATRFVIKNNQCLIDRRCFWGLGIFSIQNRSTIFGFVPLCRQLILYRFIVCLKEWFV